MKSRWIRLGKMLGIGWISWGYHPIRPLIPGALPLAGTEMPGSHEYDKFLPKAGRKKVAAQGWTRGKSWQWGFRAAHVWR